MRRAGSILGFLVFVVRRLLWAVFLFFTATIAIFVLFWIVPPDPAVFKQASLPNPAVAAEIRHYLRLDEPIWRQYLIFVWRLVAHQSLGISFANRESVDAIVGRAAPVTASLVLGGAVIWLLVSIPLGVFAGLHPRSLVDRGTTIVAFIGLSAHPVWLGLLLSYVFGYRLGWTPIEGYCSVGSSPLGECSGAGAWAYHLILPWATFSLFYVALYFRFVRVNVIETNGEDYVRTARSKGAGERRVVLHHVLRNSMLPVVTILGMDLGIAIGIALFTETVFGLPGLGFTMIQAYNADDMPLLVGIFVFTALCIVVLNLIVDIAYSFLDPRIRMW
jgi:peptide/nickel transport system permease protein